VVGNDRFGNGGADGVNLSGHTTTLYTNTDIKVGELVLTKDKDRLEGLESERLGLDKLNGLSIDLDEATALLGEGTCSCRLFPIRSKKNMGERQRLVMRRAPMSW